MSFLSTEDAYLRISEALRQPNQPEPVLDVLQSLYQERVGFKMLTIIKANLAQRVGRRIFTTNPHTHPVGRDKPITDSNWADHVLIGQELFVANSVEEFRPHYTDWEMLQAMGIGSAINYPVVVDGITVGTVNLTAEPDFYTPERVAAGKALSGLAAIAFLLLQQDKTND